MHVIPKSLLLGLILTSCGTTNDSRYRDTQMLERPPVLPIEKRVGEQQIEPDNSSISKKRESTGLGADAYMVESKPLQLKIKQNFSDGWHSVGLALKQSEIKITDHDRNKGLYYVNYSPKGLFDLASSILNIESEQNEANYLLKLVDDGAETIITATVVDSALTKANEDSGDSKDGTFSDEDVASLEGAEDLLRRLHETLRDDLKEE